MSVVEIYTKDGKKLGTIDELNNTVVIEEEWKRITEAKNKRKNKKVEEPEEEEKVKE